MATRRRAFGSIRQVGRTSWEASYKVEGQRFKGPKTFLSKAMRRRAQDPAVLFGPEDIVGDLLGLEIERAQRAGRPVASDDGEVDAIDAIVRAARRSEGRA